MSRNDLLDIRLEMLAWVHENPLLFLLGVLAVMLLVYRIAYVHELNLALRKGMISASAAPPVAAAVLAGAVVGTAPWLFPMTAFVGLLALAICFVILWVTQTGKAMDRKLQVMRAPNDQKTKVGGVSHVD
jgi:hypothetical protein